MTARPDYKEVLGFEPPIPVIAAIVLGIVAFAICCIALGFLLATYF